MLKLKALPEIKCAIKECSISCRKYNGRKSINTKFTKSWTKYDKDLTMVSRRQLMLLPECWVLTKCSATVLNWQKKDLNKGPPLIKAMKY